MTFPIPVELVGSMPRPQALQDLYAAYDAGTATLEELEAAQDEASKDTIERCDTLCFALHSLDLM